MVSENKTSADIIAEMRNLGKLDEKSIDKIPRSLMGLGLRTYADCLEAALKRGWESLLTKQGENVNSGSAVYTGENNGGNAAALREALENLVYNIELRASVFDIFSIVDRKAWMDAKAALSVPARNCDRFEREIDAQIVFLNEVWLISVDEATMLERDRFENWTDEMRAAHATWLLAPAAEREGETNA